MFGERLLISGIEDPHFPEFPSTNKCLPNIDLKRLRMCSLHHLGSYA